MTLLNTPDWIAKIPFFRAFALKGADLKNGKKTSGGTQVQIINEFKDRNRKDNEDWRASMMAAEDPNNPRWAALQDLFDYVGGESHFQSQWELRTSASTCSRFYILNKSGDEDTEKTKLFKTEWFENFILEVLTSKIKKYTILQLIEPATMKFYSVPRRNFIPQKNIVLQRVNEDVGVVITEPGIKDIIYVSDNHDFGMLNDIVPLILWKMNAMMSWAEATEKYGIPPLIATTNKSDTKTLSWIQNMLKEIGESLTAILPEGTKIDVMQNYEKVDPEKMFGGFLTACDNGISKRIVGGTMISDNGSSRSQSETHQKNFDDKLTESDKRKIEFVVNGQLIPMMRNYGYKLDEGDLFAFDRSQKISLKDLWDIVKGMLENYDIEEDWLKKTFQIPITGKKATPISPQPNASFNQPTTALAAALVGKGVHLPTYIASCGHNHSLPTAGISFGNILSELSDELINDVFKGRDTLVNEVLKSIASYQKLNTGLLDGWEKRASLTYDATDNHCMAMMEYNLFEFSRLKEKANVFALNELLIDRDTNNVRTFDDFKAQAKKYLNTVDDKYLRTEYNQSVAVGQNASRYHRFKSEEDTVTQWVKWQTVGDSHVRPEHALLNGKVFSLKDSSGLTVWPPKDWGCRCEFVQYLGKPPKEDVYTNEQGLQTLGIEKGSKWNVNRGKIEQVFTANEMYVKSNNLANEEGKLTYKQYGLLPVANMKNLPILTLDKTITEANVKELFKPLSNQINGKEVMGFEDYLNRKLTLNKAAFDKHTSGKYLNDGEERHKLFPHIGDVLRNPDEVYFIKYDGKGGKASFQTNYVKFYDGEAVIVNTGIGSSNVEINTWYKAKVDESQFRKGYLIKSKKS
jgi:SPP1 gp7 family putative phage head morphogenesis protein